jgi:hypothetical protein
MTPWVQTKTTTNPEVRRVKYEEDTDHNPHQGEKERARRRRQMKLRDKEKYER